ncbi:MAG: hypothetical protein ACOYOJ_19430 [Alsobacter sp.]|jgi:hypothetical protein
MADVIFEKRSGKYDARLVLRDGAWLETPCPKQAPILHDMFHHAVETILGRRGFLHRHAAGEGEGFRMTPEAVSEALERLVETMQADSWSGRPDPAEVIDLYLATCAVRGDAPIPVTADDIVAIRVAIDDLAARWAQVPVGGRLVVSV